MKKLLILLTALSALSLQACEKDSPGDNYDFSTSIPPYITIQSLKDQVVKQGASATVNLQMRTSLQQEVTATYKLTGAINLDNQTTVVERDKTTGLITVAIPANMAVGSEVVVTLVKAITKDGMSMTIGQDNNPDKQKVTIKVAPM
ncbi:hypothetical protein [Solitalea longa]|nr:hypothetical protein [Solitalea longa]